MKRASVKHPLTETTTTLRTGVVYDILVEYGDLNVREEGVEIDETSGELELTVPLSEGSLVIVLIAGNEPLTEGAQVEILDGENMVLDTADKVLNRYDTTMLAGAEYTVRVQYRRPTS